MIEFCKVRQELQGEVAVADVSFAIAKPTMLCIVGRSGAGKSTTLRILHRL